MVRSGRLCHPHPHANQVEAHSDGNRLACTVGDPNDDGAGCSTHRAVTQSQAVPQPQAICQPHMAAPSDNTKQRYTFLASSLGGRSGRRHLVVATERQRHRGRAQEHT